MASRLEAIIALLDEAVVIIVVALIGVYILHSTGVISLAGALVILLSIAVIIAVVAWRVAEAQISREKVGPEALTGRIGVVVEPLNPEGIILVDGELWKARSQQPVDRNRKVRILGYRGLTLIVEPVNNNGRMQMRENHQS